MADEKIKSLCEKIYREHKQAIDLIIIHRPDPRPLIFEKLKGLIEANSSLVLEYCTNSYVRFMPLALDLPYFKCGSEYLSKRLFLFEFHITKESVFLFIEMGPGDSKVRKQVYDFALDHKKTFQTDKRLYPQWQSIFKKPIIEELESDMTQEAIIEAIEIKWQEFLENDLPRIEEKILGHQWSAA